MGEPWKGPWRCEKCGVTSVQFVPSHFVEGFFLPTSCPGILRPFDRRAPDPALAGLIEALKKILGWREFHDHFPDRLPRDIVAWMEGIANTALEATRKGTT